LGNGDTKHRAEVLNRKGKKKKRGGGWVSPVCGD